MAEAKHPRKTKTVRNEADELRRGAEERLDRLSDVADSASPALEDVAAIVHELRVHQIELEMQNQELRRAQLDLEASRKKYFELFDLAPVGYLTLSRESIVRDANLTATRLLGVDRRQLVKNPFTAFICAPDQDVFYRHQQMLEQTGEPQTCELRLKRTAGEADAEAALGHFWAHLEGRPRAADGATRLFSVTFTDITERKQAEREQARVEKLLRATFEQAAVGIAHVDTDGAWLRVNQCLCDMFGYTREELCRITFADITHPDDVDASVEQFRKLLAGDEDTYDTEKRYVRKDGSPVWVSLSVALIRDEDGAPDYFLSVLEDTTERKASQQELADSQRFLSRILDASPNLIYIYNLVEQRNVYVNREITELLGYTSEQISAFGSTLFEHILHPEDTERVAQHQARFAMNNDVAELEIEYRMQHADGEWRWLRSRDVAFARDGQGRVTEILGFSEDITAARVVEEELAQQRERLDRTLTSVIDIAGNIVEMRDPHTAGHQRRVAELAVWMARDLGMSESEVADIEVAGLLHDVGKAGVPTEILGKPGVLSASEFSLIKDHAQAGYQIVVSANMGEPIAEMVYQHHERCDGSGYPRGLVGEQMLGGTKVLAVADVVEAMSSHRPYRPALGIEAALAEIREHAGVKYDADVVAVCVHVFEQGFVFTQP
jgi:PAS domain S-box-containing protein/putative nucleotidyltransferase with HDIG domain